ncbi:g111 [Coccomyxa viridis]|uniref:G111 protein n=1 Tax=Coccomyxa viridis TaxID=1274662 RepID=A0ABP1FIK1_9CHLO
MGGQFSYSELDYTNTDLVINNTFSSQKGEIANNGDGTVIVARGMDGSLNKVSIVGSGDLVMRGNGTYSELFSAGSGNRYLSGFQGQLNIKHDGSGAVKVNPGSKSLMIGGVNTGDSPVSYTKGNCTVRKDPNAGPAMVGNACTQVNSVSVPRMSVLWTCGIAVQGDYACGGGGAGGPPSVTKIPCSVPQSSLTMFTLDSTTQ